MRQSGSGSIKIERNTSDPIVEEQVILDKKLIAIDNIVEEVRSEKPVADYQMEQKKIDKINQYNEAKTNPYFGRLDILEDKITDTIYIGQKGIAKSNAEIVVVDWRADIAKVFYSYNGGNPIIEYSSMDGRETRIVTVNKKRQIQIKNRKVHNVIEVRNNEKNIAQPKVSDGLKFSAARKSEEANGQSATSIQNESLANILSGKSENHEFKDIIATIQVEQDEIIRLPLDKSIIVQGVAGSGKSSVALHRISYLLYHYRDRLRPDQILIMGPNTMFLSYIQSVIPTLEIHDVHQSTFLNWALEQMKDMKLQAADPTEKLSRILDKKLIYGDILDISQFKGSIKLKQVVDKLLDSIDVTFGPRGNLYVNADFYIEEKTIDNFYKGKKNLPINKRVHSLHEYLRSSVREGELKFIEKVRSEFDLIHDKWITLLTEGSEERRKIFLTFESIKEQRISKIKSEFKFALDQYIKRLELINPLDIYKQLFIKEILLSMEMGLEEEFLDRWTNSSTGEIEYEDLGILLYIHGRLNGWNEKFEYIVVDEAQDHSPLELCILSSLSNSVMILGDITQNIYDYRGINDWKSLFPGVFREDKTYSMNMDTSYRSTYEIMALANTIIANSKLDLPRIRPVMRRGEVPKIKKVLHGKDLSKNILESIDVFKKKGYKTISIICKDVQQSKNVYEYLLSSGLESIQMIDTSNEELKEQIIVIPSFLSKGLEFDAVIIPNASIERFDPKNVIDIKLLFVSVTRAHHELHIFYHGEVSPLLPQEIVKEQEKDALNNIL